MDKVELRDVIDEDIPFIYQWENDEANWEVSETKKAYTEDEILALVTSAQDYMETRQKRWMIIENGMAVPIGTIDIFQGELKENETGIGILIANTEKRRKGYAEQAVNKVLDLASISYGIDNFYVTIQSNNLASLNLFEKCGFRAVPTLEDNSNFGSESSEIITMSLCVKK